MIALNELIEKIEIFRERYKVIDESINLDDILLLEKERKEIQLKFEHLRAECNKQCHELALKKANNEDLSELYNEILIKDRQIKDMEFVLDKYGKKINERLMKLPNLPDRTLDEDEKYFCETPQQIKLNGFAKKLFERLCENLPFCKEGSSLTGNEYMESLQNVLFSEEESYKIVNCKCDTFVVLLPEFEVDNVMERILGFLNTEKINYYIKKTKSIEKSSALEIEIILNDKQRVVVSLKREFFTRAYNIKYRNKRIDMTKFVNQINILCHT